MAEGYAAYGYDNGTRAMNAASVPGVGDTPESPSQIRDRLTEAEGQLANLHATISHVESRLDTILTPDPPRTLSGTGKDAPTPVGPPASDVLNRTRTLQCGISEASERLRALMKRIEL